MPLSYHVPGRSVLSIDGDELGVAVDGIEISTQVLTEDIFSDDAGPLMPADVQNMGKIVTVKADLVSFDEGVLATALGSFANDIEGEVGTIGKLYFQQTGTHTLSISTDNVTGAEPDYSFANAYLANVATWKVGVRRKVCSVEFRCLGDGSDSTIYTKS